MSRLPSILLSFLLLAGWALPAAALESRSVASQRATVSLLSDTDAVTPGQPFHIGLHIRLAPGWHTYWKNPGDAGAPPDIALTLSPGSQAGPISWPVPQRVTEGQLMTYAYTGDLLLPISITPAATRGATTVKAHAQWLVCREICVPEEADFQLDLPAGVAAPSAQAPLFAALDRQLPRPSPWQSVIGSDGTIWVQGPELTPATVVDAWFIPDTPGAIRDSAAQPLTVWQGGFTLALKPAKAFQAADGLSGILSVRDRSGLETDVMLRATPGIVPPPPPTMRLQRMLGLAFLGGLILNLMPCVFPVLAMKAVGLAGTPRGGARWQAVAYTAGVLVAFAGLGAALLVARAAGAAAGWGFQFQSPIFVTAMTWLLFAVGLNLSGVYQIGTGLTHTGQGLAARKGQLGSFFTGLLAVVVATPCTAPFMGVAIAAGLAAPPPVTMLVFLVMGLGLAAPYAVLAAMPALGRLTPKPGHWMEVLRQALAFPMYGASAWLVWVVSQEAGSAGVLGTAAGLVLLGFAAWVLGITQQATDRSRRIGQSAAAAALLAALAVLGGIASAPAVPLSGATEAGAEAFTPARLAALRAEGRPVFVNMTAAWCVTCLVNERVALGTAAVRRTFADHHVAYLRGDWTRQDPAITDYLRENGREGVPLYVYYPPRGQPEVLPQILTENGVISQLDRG
ncbi:MAG TPA: protein-disulfide reductase DsbD domain-containing protein [Acetobacteraceae bacterium]|jgi:thiol:disulfide interchange protein DsbD|nr:protein-disulfide reductase DsbD domain-containing protein [Acetobacteraceae bacterium]